MFSPGTVFNSKSIRVNFKFSYASCMSREFQVASLIIDGAVLCGGNPMSKRGERKGNGKIGKPGPPPFVCVMDASNYASLQGGREGRRRWDRSGR